MADIVTIEYETWEEFKANVIRELFGAGIFRSGRFLFRGHCSSEWGLESTFDRYFPYLEGSQRQKVADQLLQYFSVQTKARNLLQYSPEEVVKILAFAQHYGLPTRLLDWTESPYIAAFFAFSDVVTLNPQSQRICIWVLDTQSKVWGRDTRVEIVSPPGDGNERLRNQMGSFTVNWSSHRKVEDYIENSATTDEPLRKMLVPAKEAFKAIADLDAMSINHINLFSGIEGCIKSARLRLAISLAEDESSPSG